MSRREKGFRELARISEGTGAGISGRLEALSPVLSEILVGHSYGTVFARPELSRYAREIATVAMLAAGGYRTELAIHLEAALRVGVALPELVALAEHVSVYAGVPRMIEMADLLSGMMDGARPPVSGRRFSMSDHETEVLDSGGSGPPLLLLHATGSSRWSFQGLVALLGGSHRVMAFDLRGHGAASGAPGALSMDLWARDIAFFLDRTGLGKVHIGGLSMGASIALFFGEHYGDRVRSLTAMAPPTPDPERFLSMARSIVERGVEPLVGPTLARWFTPEFLGSNPWEVRICRETLLRMDPLDWSGAFLALADLPVARASRWGFPVTFISGGSDRSVSPDSVHALAKGYPGASVKVIDHAPHQMSLETPESLVPLLRESARDL